MAITSIMRAGPKTLGQQHSLMAEKSESLDKFGPRCSLLRSQGIDKSDRKRSARPVATILALYTWYNGDMFLSPPRLEKLWREMQDVSARDPWRQGSSAWFAGDLICHAGRLKRPTVAQRNHCCNTGVPRRSLGGRICWYTRTIRGRSFGYIEWVVSPIPNSSFRSGQPSTTTTYEQQVQYKLIHVCTARIKFLTLTLLALAS